MSSPRCLLIWLAVVAMSWSGAPRCGAADVPTSRVAASEPLLQPHDRVALLGGTFVERMQIHGDLEWNLQRRRPDWQLRVRNVGWSGDTVSAIARKRFDDLPGGWTRRVSDLEAARPTVTLIFYGHAEASAAEMDTATITADLKRLIDECRQAGSRVILATPTAMPGYRVPEYAANLARFRQLMQDVAQEHSTAMIELNWTPTPDELTNDQLLPNRAGYARLAETLADALVGPASHAGDVLKKTSSEPLRRAIAEKNALFFNQYRPQNETYLLLFRKHEQGNNVVEIDALKQLVEQSDEAIWSAAGPTTAAE